jgi:hypothetical protein
VSGATGRTGHGGGAGLLPHGHLCWGYWDRADFLARGIEFMLDGIRGGQRVEYVGSGSVEQLRDELLRVDGAGAALDPNAVRYASVRDFYRFSGHSGVVDPAASVAARISAAEEALAAGYTGSRAVVDATAVARTPQQREAFARLEHLIDRRMSAEPISGLCAYDLGELGRQAVAEMACLHPATSEGVAAFRLHADQGADLALAGEVDISCLDLFATTLARILPLSCVGRELAVDGRGLEFINHRGLLAIDRHAVANDRDLVLRSRSSVLVEVAGLLPLQAVRVEQAA